MSYSKSPLAFFGKTYAVASSAITLVHAGHAGTTTGTTVSCAVADTVLFAAVHGLIVGDRVRFTQVTTLPTGLAAATDYYVKTVVDTTNVTLSTTRGGATLAITASGTSDNTCQVMGALDEVDATEATASSTGDWRKVCFGIIEMIYQRWTSLATDDRPAKMTVSRSSSVNETSGEITRYYTISFVTAPTGTEVVSE